MTAALVLLILAGDAAGARNYLLGFYEGEARAARRKSERKN